MKTIVEIKYPINNEFWSFDQIQKCPGVYDVYEKISPNCHKFLDSFYVVINDATDKYFVHLFIDKSGIQAAQQHNLKDFLFAKSNHKIVATISN